MTKKANNNNFQQNQRQLPIAKNEDVEFSQQLADSEDLEALERMNAADDRQES